MLGSQLAADKRTPPRARKESHGNARSSSLTTEPTTTATHWPSAELFADAGASVALAYVRHAQAADRGREELEQHESLHRLERGAAELGRPDTELHVVMSASTSNGLRALADREHADIVVFGSEYRTARGHVAPGTSAQRMIDGGSVAIAIAPVGLRDRDRRADHDRSPSARSARDDSALETARSIAAATGADVVAAATREVGLLVVGSRPEAAVGQVLISASAEPRGRERDQPGARRPTQHGCSTSAGRSQLDPPAVTA